MEALHLRRAVSFLTALLVASAGVCAPALADGNVPAGEPLAGEPYIGTAQFFGIIEGRHGSQVQLRWRRFFVIHSETEKGWTWVPTNKLHYVRLTPSGTFSLNFPGCLRTEPPNSPFGFGCQREHYLYEVVATYKRQPCTTKWFFNVAAGEPVNMSAEANKRRAEHNEPPWLKC